MTSEFEFISNLKDHFNLSKIGDDCAVLPSTAKKDLVITTDLLVEDIDFRLKWAKPEFIGHKALTVSLSDVAAMGAKPVWSMISIGIPHNVWKTDFVDAFYEGYMHLAKKFNIELIGGDVSKTPDKIVIDSIVAGEVEKGKAVLRSTAKPGDLLFVTGKLGGAAMGLNLFEQGVRYKEESNSLENNLLTKQLKPLPQNGEILANIATSMIDLSDGLSNDLAHICHASAVGAKIYENKIPIDSDLQKYTDDFNRQIDLALNGGEDFELLFTVNPKNRSNKILKDFHHIGKITERVGNIELINDNESVVLPPKAFTHF